MLKVVNTTVLKNNPFLSLYNLWDWFLPPSWFHKVKLELSYTGPSIEETLWVLVSSLGRHQSPVY